ncbi:trypsin-like peptidase domain-containing protein [Planctomycetaceae bacterium SH139]
MLQHRATIALMIASAAAPYASGQAPAFPRLSPPQSPAPVIESAPVDLAPVDLAPVDLAESLPTAGLLPADSLLPNPGSLAPTTRSVASDRYSATRPREVGPPAGQADGYAALAAEASALQRMENVVKLVAKLVRPCVVHIEASKTEAGRGRAASYDEAGSGVIISRSAGLWVLTNRHVIHGSSRHEITLRMHDGRSLQPLRILEDASTDVAVLQLPAVELSAARIGSSEGVGVGDFVLAVGSPFGLSHSVTFGIISALGRRDLTLGAERIELQDFFQTDAAINPGNSGGPLLNLRGEVIGLNTAIASSSGGSEGIGFAIPMDMVMQVVDQLIVHGQVRRAYLGVSLAPEFAAADALRMGLPQPGGALIKTVREKSPALQAGLRVGDVITEFDGVRIENDDHLVTRVGLTAVGRSVPVVLYRDGNAYQTKVTVAAIP